MVQYYHIFAKALMGDSGKITAIFFYLFICIYTSLLHFTVFKQSSAIVFLKIFDFLVPAMPSSKASKVASTGSLWTKSTANFCERTVPACIAWCNFKVKKQLIETIYHDRNKRRCSCISIFWPFKGKVAPGTGRSYAADGWHTGCSCDQP